MHYCLYDSPLWLQVRGLGRGLRCGGSLLFLLHFHLDVLLLLYLSVLLREGNGRSKNAALLPP